MSGSTSVLLLALLAATPGPTGAQPATTGGWTHRQRRLHHLRPHRLHPRDPGAAPAGLGHHPRLDSARVADSVRAIQKPVLRAGLAAGLSQWPEDLWGACEAVSGLGRSRT